MRNIHGRNEAMSKEVIQVVVVMHACLDRGTNRTVQVIQFCS
jgi:hypothetical protein